MRITVTNEFPASDKCGCPLPYIDYTGKPQNTTLNSDLNSGRIYRRARFLSQVYKTLQVKWVLSAAQYDVFQEFYSGLGNGISRFSLDLRFPKHSELTEWEVQLVGPYSADFQDGLWIISASLNLIQPMTIAEPAEAES